MELSEFSEIYLPLSQPLYRVALYFLENEDDACDVVQDLYLKIWNARDTLDFIHNPRAYCITMVRNLCLDRIRMAGRIGETHKAGKITEQHPPDCLSSGDDPQGLLENKETLQQIINAIQHLPDKHRTVLRMKIFEPVSHPQEEDFLGTAWTMVMDLTNPSVTYYSRRHFDNPSSFQLDCRNE